MKKTMGCLLMVLVLVSPVWADTFIQVMCEPGVRIFLDGTLKGVSNADDGGLIIEGVAPGAHAIKAVREGFAPQEDQLSVKDGEVKVYQLRRFVPEVKVSQEGVAAGGAIEQQVGTLIIQSLPVQCEIDVSGTSFSGRNALQKTQDKWTAQGISAGKHTVSATARGKTLRHEIDMVPQGMVHLFFNFMSGEVEVRAETRPEPSVEESLVVATVVQEDAPGSPDLTLEQQLERVQAQERALIEKRAKLDETLANPPAGMQMADISNLLDGKQVLEAQLVQLTQEKQRLQIAMETQEKTRFEREYAEYLRIVSADGINDALRLLAWKEICRKWKVAPGDKPGKLVWNDAKACAVVGEVLEEGKVRTVDLGGGISMEFMPIAAGSFQMGSTSGDSDETPVHQVTLSKPFWLARTEVTQAQWRQVMGSNPSNFKGDTLPVEQVSWNDAMEFCRKLTERERQAGRLPAGFEYTLPTEAQWEYACRAGTNSDYAGNLDTMAWYSSNSGSKTHEVGTKQANAWGLYDMHGNVWEWCLDWHGNYASGNAVDPQGASSGSRRVARGGSWFIDAGFCRSAFRFRCDPTSRHADLGFRVCLSAR